MSNLREAIRDFINPEEKIFWGAPHHVHKPKVVRMIANEAASLGGWKKAENEYVLDKATSNRIFNAVMKLDDLVGKWEYAKRIPVVLSENQKKILSQGIASLKEMQQASHVELAFLNSQIQKGIDPSLSETLNLPEQEIKQIAEDMNKDNCTNLVAWLSRMPDEQGGFITRQREERASKFGDPARGVEGSITAVIQGLEAVQRAVEAKRGRS